MAKFEKGHTKLGGRKKGTPNKETLSKLERRAMFEQRISEKWEAIIDQLPPTYIADQFLGKAGDKLDITSGDQPINMTPELIAEAKELLKKKMRGDGK